MRSAASLTDSAAQLEVGQDLPHPDEELAEALADIEGLEDLDFLLEREIG